VKNNNATYKVYRERRRQEKTIEINNGSFNDRDGPVNNNCRRRIESSIFRFEM